MRVRAPPFMIQYTDGISFLMQDIVTRVPALGFIDMSEVLVFARHGRSERDGAFATCHCLTLPTSEPGYYFWRDRLTGRLTRRSEWFVTKSPEVTVGGRRLKYLISFVLPRFCDQSLDRSRKRQHYRNVETEPWIAKLDTIVHELYHIDPADDGIRRIERTDGTYSPRSHGPGFYEQVSSMVQQYLASGPNPAMYDFLRHGFDDLETRFGGVVGTTFRNFPSFPQLVRLDGVEVGSASDGVRPDSEDVRVEALKPRSQPTLYTEDDLVTHHFLQNGARRLTRKGQHRAA
jgi:hypothetical protein